MGIFRHFFGVLVDSSNHASADGIMGVHFKDAVSTFDRMTQEANSSYDNMTPRSSRATPKQATIVQKAIARNIRQKTIPTARVAPQNATKNTEAIRTPKLRQPMGSKETTSAQDAPVSRIESRQTATLYDNCPKDVALKITGHLHQEDAQDHVRNASSSTAASNLSSSSSSSNRTLKKKNRVNNLAGLYQTHSRTSSSSTDLSDSSALHHEQAAVIKKKEKKSNGLRKVHQEPERKRQPTHKRIRSVSVTQVSSSESVSGSDESVLVTFPSFELAGKAEGNIEELLAVENKLAKYQDADEDNSEWGFDPAALDGGICTQLQHENIVTYDAYSAQDVIQQIYKDLPERESPGFGKSTKRAENLLFGNYKHGSYKKISPGGPRQQPKKAGAWSFATLHKFMSRLFWKTDNKDV